MRILIFVTFGAAATASDPFKAAQGSIASLEQSLDSDESAAALPDLPSSFVEGIDKINEKDFPRLAASARKMEAMQEKIKARGQKLKEKLASLDALGAPESFVQIGSDRKAFTQADMNKLDDLRANMEKLQKQMSEELDSIKKPPTHSSLLEKGEQKFDMGNIGGLTDDASGLSGQSYNTEDPMDEQEDTSQRLANIEGDMRKFGATMEVDEEKTRPKSTWSSSILPPTVNDKFRNQLDEILPEEMSYLQTKKAKVAVDSKGQATQLGDASENLRTEGSAK